MARLTNTPIQTLALDLERRKSYSFRCVVLNNERNPLDLSGCVVRFVMKESEYDGDLYDMTNLIVNSEGVIASPESGEISFSFQAAELDGPPGEYNYSIVMWTADGFSIVLLKGVLNLHPNTESLSVTRTYTTGTANAAIEVVLRGNDVIEVIANTVPQGVGGSNILGTGRPDNPSTLEARSLALVASAPIGTVFVSLDGAGTGLWAWRKRAAGWFVIEGGPVAWTSLTGIPSTFNPSAHNHDIANINGLSAALAAKSPAVHSHAVTDITGLRAELDAKSAVVHTHSAADVSGLQAALNSKSPVVHSHTAANINSGAATDGHVLTADGAGGAAWEAPPAGGGGTGSGIELVSGTVTLVNSGSPIREFYCISAATIGGISFPTGTAVVWRRTTGNQWGYIVVDGWTVPGSDPDPELIPVTATAPNWTDDTTDGGGAWTTPSITGVTYSPVSGTATPGQTVTVTATAQTGYQLTGTTSWTHTFPIAGAPDPVEVTATAPTWTDDTDNGGGTWSTPTITGVTYSPASGTATAGQSVTVTATANSGYTLTGTSSWTHQFPAAPSGPAIVQTKVIQGTSITLDAAPTPGNLLVIGVGTNADPADFTFSHGLTLDGTAGPNGGWRVGMASAIVQSGATATVTVTGMGTNPRLTVWELAGVAGFVDSDTDQSADGYGKSLTFTTGGDFTLIHIHTDGAPGATTTTGGIVMDSTAADSRGLSAHAHPATTGGTITWTSGRRATGIAGGYA